ncbi:recombinase family protein [Candidatus Saccharibacteria bacterium]|nr:recombinase family protein [Candidatus Saccharibacteria bacterium]
MLRSPKQPRSHERKVIVIPSNSSIDPKSIVTADESSASKLKRVAAYARVSTEQEEQEGSFYSQISFYTDYINENPNWQLVRVYADRGLSGTSYKHRPEFSQMIEDAKAGKIDLILTKSVSRFARNTVDSLVITRELKATGVEVFFEKEGISSMDRDAELMFTIMSSIAQEESRTISENVRWGLQRNMEAGKVYMPYSAFLGYRKGKDGKPEIVPSEAKTVRLIYQLFLDGKKFRSIARYLESENITSPRGNLSWTPGTIKSILTNEKYKGDARLQKTYIVDFLTKEVRINHGERKQYYVQNSHPAIISPETFERVQEEMMKRLQCKKKTIKTPSLDIM